MKLLAAFLLSFSLPAVHVTPAPRAPVAHTTATQARQRGVWRFAENGHAVYCYGPVLLVADAQGNLRRMATFCRDGQTMVPLKD
jgi:hypothetical protein